ncbi:L,D-transpeptidase family protein [Pseudomonas sp. EL_65y_Pfl2_R95]|uniref:L,D-transpeptidase family protein n=1 Tax=Pseudomonas sp. EL_65y_Pfl2_R95 TaxID=3088698 RepID=UPI0030DBB0FB
MIKKRAVYSVFALFLAPFVGHAVTLPPLDSNPADSMSVLIDTLSTSCAPLPTSLDDLSRSQLHTFYQPLAGELAWPNEAARVMLLEQINQLADDGLSPTDYPLASMPLDASPKLRACIDIQTTRSYLQALHDLHYGRFSQQKLESIWRSPDMPKRPQADATIMPLAMANTAEPEVAFKAARPSLMQYLQLRAAYAALRQRPLSTWQAIDEGPTLHPGQSDPRVPALRTRLNAEGYNTITGSGSIPSGNRLDDGTVAALKVFQSRHGINDDGVLGAATLTELNVSPLVRREQLRVNLERLRWLADDLSQAQVAVNVAGAEVLLMDKGAEVWRRRTQVGRAERKTPLLVSRINRVTLNPTWTVPPTILREDKIPAIRSDIGYLDKHQMNVYNYQGQRLDPHTINWASPGAIMLRQEAGVNNPLGRVVLRFDNPYSVYLHDTPSQRLFDRSPRVFSSGCVRVESIETLLTKILSEDELRTVQARLDSGKTSQYRLDQQLNLVMAYWTVEVGADGVVHYFPDMYSNDQKIITAQLHDDNPAIADSRRPDMND